MAIGFDVFKQHRLSIMAAVLMATMWGLPLQSYAASPEQRCTGLGANCLCSEPLQMTAFTQYFDWYDPLDSTTKQCNGESASIGNGGAVITRTTGSSGATAPLVGTDAAVLAALPSGHSVARYMRGTNGHVGIYEFGHVLAGGDPRQRVAVRWYQYYSTNYEFANMVTCLNSSKWFSMTMEGQGIHTQWDSTNGANSPWLIYSWTGWLPELDCCNWGPGWSTFTSIPPQALTIKVGKWYLVEVILRNATGTGAIRLEAYRRNITDNESEFKVIDTSVACIGCGTTQDWTAALGATTNLRPPGALTRIEPNLFRNGSCAGYRAYSHLMVAAWSTDAGQRIGAAAEIEGGADPVSPAAPLLRQP